MKESNRNTDAGNQQNFLCNDGETECADFFRDPVTVRLASDILAAAANGKPYPKVRINRHIRGTDLLSETQKYILLAAAASLPDQPRPSSSTRFHPYKKDASPYDQRPAIRETSPPDPEMRKALPPNGKTVLVLGLVRTGHAEHYAFRPNEAAEQHFDVNERLGRDNVRVGELLLNGFDVYSVSVAMRVEDPVQYAEADFMHRRFSRTVSELLAGRTRLDYVLDEWYYIPRNWDKSGSSFYDKKKWYNMIELKKAGLMNAGCRVIVPAHANAVEALFGKDSAPLQKQLREHFALSFLRDRPSEMMLNPLWAATQSPGAMQDRLSADVAERFREKIDDNLHDGFINGAELRSIPEPYRSLFAPHSVDRPAFIVWTARNASQTSSS